MSIPVDLDALREELARRQRPAYLVTVGDSGPPHLIATFLRWSEDAFVAPAGRHTSRNVEQRPFASVVVPPDEPGGYSLIFDADARIDGDVVRLGPTKAVLHRPAEGEGDPGSCGHDCAPVA